MLELYKDGDNMGIVTDAPDERTFTELFSSALSTLIDNDVHAGDWDFQLGIWLPQYADIVGKLRGYKTDVKTSTVMVAGEFMPNTSCREVVVDGNGKVSLTCGAQALVPEKH